MSAFTRRRMVASGTVALLASQPATALAQSAPTATPSPVAATPTPAAQVAGAVQAAPSLADWGQWPQFHGAANHAGLGKAPGPRGLTLAWYLPASGDVDGGPVIAGDGTIYVASAEGTVHGLSAEGGTRWTFRAGTPILGSVTLMPDWRVVFGDARGRVRALNAVDGSLSWMTSGFGSVRGTPVSSATGQIFFGTDRGELVSLDEKGKERFRNRAELDIISSPSIGPNGDVYWGSRDKKLRRMSPNGDIRWTVDLGGEIAGAAAIAGDGTVVVGAGDALFALDGDNSATKWRFPAGGGIVATPAIGADGTIFVGTLKGRFVALRADGSVRWEATTGGEIRSSAAVGPDGVVYFGSGDGLVYTYDANGQRLSTYRTLGSVHGATALGINGMIYVGARDNRLYALRDEARRFVESPADKLGGELVRDPVGGKTYVIVLGKRRHIPDPVTLGMLGLAGPLPVTMNASEQARYPEGPALPALAENTVIRDANGLTYTLKGGMRTWLKNEEELAATGVQPGAIVSITEDIIVRSVPLRVENGMLIKGGGERVYAIEDGKRRWVSTQSAFEARGFSWTMVHFVSEAAATAIPEGEAIA